MNYVVNENKLYIYLVISYFPIMQISNILGVKLNLIIALLIALLAIWACFKDKFLTLLLISTFIVVSIKVIITGVYGFKPFLIVLLGPLILRKFIVSLDSIDHKSILFLVRLLILYLILVAIIVILQKLNILPNSIGAISFVNTAGASMFGEIDLGERPSGYFYHPYDTALCLIPLVIYFTVNYKFIIGRLLVPFILSFSLGLKGFIVFCMAYSVIPVGFYNKINYKVILFLFLFLSVFMFMIAGFEYSHDTVAITAGRLVIWNIMVHEYLSQLNIITLLLGYNEDLLGNSLFWLSDESYTTHNQYLFSVIYQGFFFMCLTLYFLLKVVKGRGELIIVLLISMLSLGLTGDLFVFLTFWVMLSCVTLVNRASVIKSGNN